MLILGEKMKVRICTVLMQSVVLALVPWSAMFLIGSTVGKTHSIMQAGFFVLLLLGGGSVFLAIAFFISSVIEGEYTAPL